MLHMPRVDGCAMPCETCESVWWQFFSHVYKVIQFLRSTVSTTVRRRRLIDDDPVSRELCVHRSVYYPSNSWSGMHCAMQSVCACVVSTELCDRYMKALDTLQRRCAWFLNMVNCMDCGFAVCLLLRINHAAGCVSICDSDHH